MCGSFVYVVYFFVMLDGVERKKERKKKKEEEAEQNRNFFLDCDKKSWESGALIDIKMAKVFHL